MPEDIEITLCERPMRVPKHCSLFALREQYKHGADVMVLNGFPINEDRTLADGDAVVFIRRGEIPDQSELEALMAARHTPGVHAILKKATVGIAGLGGLGSSVAVALARVGAGRLILVDFDVVEPSNLNRQQYFVDQIGMPKTEALAANLRRINPFIHLEAHQLLLDAESIPRLFCGADVLVEAFDTAEAKAMLAESWRAAYPERPVVLASGLAGYHSANTIVTRRMGKAMALVGDMDTAAGPGMGLMAPRVGVAAHHQANAVLRLLLGESPE